MHRKLAFLSDVYGEQISFKSKQVDGNLVLLLKLWDLTDTYRKFDTIHVYFIYIGSVMMNALWVRFAGNWM